MTHQKLLRPFIAILFLIAGCSTRQSQMPTATLDTPTPSPTISMTLSPSPTLTPSPSSPPATPDVQAQATMTMETETAIDQQTATALAFVPSNTPTNTLTPTLSPTPDATSLARATLEALGEVCQPNGTFDQYGSGVSPDEKWAAISCYGGPVSLERDSFLLVLSLDGTKQWSLYFRDYANGGGYDAKDNLGAYRWSPDGKYLYAIAGSRLSGCCWIGNLILLVRLNLETGAQTAFLNGMGENNRNPLNFAISDDSRYLFNSPQRGSLDITNLSASETQRVELQWPFSIDANFVIMSPEGDQLILGLFRLPEDGYQFVIESLVLIDLPTGKQSIVFSDMATTGKLYPFRWEDENLVLLTTYPGYPDQADFWLLNIQTGELVQTENP